MTKPRAFPFYLSSKDFNTFLNCSFFQLVIIGEFTDLFSHSSENTVDNNVIYSNHILIVNLACADALMGIYLCFLSVFAHLFSGKYCAVYLNWLTGPTCNLIGILMILSSEVSVFTLVMLAS